MHTYENSTRKKYIQQKILDQVSGIKSNALVLAGPNAKEYLDGLIKYIGTPKSVIYSYELDFSIFGKQLQLFYSDIKKYKNVKFINTNVSEASPERYIDLDLMCTIKMGRNILKALFDKQYKKYKDIDKRKVFNFSLSSIMCSHKEILSFIEELLHIKITKYEIVNFFKGNEYLLFTNNSEFQVRVYSYSDTSCMFNVLIQY